MLRGLVAAFLLLIASVGAHGAPTRVLFVGNELLESAGIPGRLGELAKSMGKDARVEAVLVPGRTLADHWADPRVREQIAKGWDHVVLQQGPSAFPTERAQLAADVRRFAVAVRAAGAKPALLMAWPRSDRRSEFPAAILSARAAAQGGVAVIPVAETWLRTLSADARAVLYAGPVNASPLGADLAVLTAWFVLFPAGPQEFDDAYVARLGRALDIEPSRIEGYVDAATRAIDEPLAVK
ncbi:MAG TPA: hypothetical protein VHQ02_12870 [Usitatibacter sp.]|nr:hypothetical protein [Usitatibacter sp.]